MLIYVNFISLLFASFQNRNISDMFHDCNIQINLSLLNLNQHKWIIEKVFDIFYTANLLPVGNFHLVSILLAISVLILCSFSFLFTTVKIMICLFFIIMYI